MQIKSPKGNPLVGHLIGYMKDPVPYLLGSATECGHRTKLRFLHKNFYILAHPEDIQQVLVRQSQAFDKGPSMKKLKLIFGQGLLTADGEMWRKNSKMMRPFFTGKEVNRLVPIMRKVIRRECAEFGPEVSNIHQRIIRLTLDIITHTIFSTSFGDGAYQFIDDVTSAMDHITYILRSPFAMPLVVPTKRNREFLRTRQRLRDQVQRMVQERKLTGEQKQDILQELLGVRNDAGERLSDHQLIDEIMTLLLAGYETIGGTVSFTLILLAQHPQWLKRLREEAEAIWSEGHEFELERSPVSVACLEESMRLWPAAWSAMRMANQDVEWNGLALKRGDIINLMPLLTHRLEEFWDHPLQFDPNRFLESSGRKHVPGAFTPFGAGPRTCIGRNMALNEGVLIVSFLAKYYDWQILNEQKQEVSIGITLRPTTNVHMRFLRRLV